MTNQSNPAELEGIELLGELHPLLQQLGTADGLFTLSAATASLQLQQVTDLATLQDFLHKYCTLILLPFELPAIHQAYTHASRHECREIVALDQQLSQAPILRDFVSASRRVGQGWIKRLRPLRDQRLVQRYLQAVENGQADGWHTLVYGITLSVYSLPVRQGLLNYARQTLRGFICAAARPLHLSHADCQLLLDNLCADLPATLEKILPSRAWAEAHDPQPSPCSKTRPVQ